MITGSIDGMRLEAGALDRIEAALDYVKGLDLRAMETGRYDIDGASYFMIQRYDSKERAAAQFEAHQRYIDIQYVFSGAECMGVARTGELQPRSDYDEARDIQFYCDPNNYAVLRLKAGEYAILFPEDCHKPSYHADDEASRKVEKAVIKIPMSMIYEGSIHS